MSLQKPGTRITAGHCRCALNLSLKAGPRQNTTSLMPPPRQAHSHQGCHSFQGTGYTFETEDPLTNMLQGSYLNVMECGCEFCQHPCGEKNREGCLVSTYFAEWAKDAGNKPDFFDSSYNGKLGDDFDIAALSIGGRHGSAWKANNQDQFLIFPIRNENGEDGLIVGVFDGHGKFGHQVSKLVRDAFFQCLSAFGHSGNTVFASPSFTQYLLRSLFQRVSSLIDSPGNDFSKSGTTAAVSAISPSWVTTAWAGDSRVVLGVTTPSTITSTRSVIPLTVDHKPDPWKCPEEAERISKFGGRVDRIHTDAQGSPTGPYRLFLKDKWIPGLAVSRSFGDYIAKDAGLIDEPEVSTLMLKTSYNKRSNIEDASSKSQQVVIMASDGLWEWITSEEAMQIAWKSENASEAANSLAELARKQWALKFKGKVCDDITVMVVFMSTKA